MAAILQQNLLSSFRDSIPAITQAVTANVLPIIDLSSEFDERLFEKLYSNQVLTARVNATYPTRGVFKAACLDPASSSSIDQKTTIDLSVVRLQKLRESDPGLVQELGQDFQQILDFYALVESNLLPLLLQATSHIAGSDLALIHAKANNNLRLIDYFPTPTTTSGPRCGSHRDYGTYTIVFQDTSVDGLQFSINDHWITVPSHIDAIVSWEWCGAILSNNRVKAAKHRVLKTELVQREERRL